MTARAPRRAWRRAETRAGALVLTLAGAVPAHAAFGGDIALASNDLFRGRSISSGRPVARAGIVYDHPSGLYGGAAGSVVRTPEAGVRPLALQVYAGYARRLGPGLTLDLGVLDTRYSQHWSGGRATGYFEAHAGLIGRRLSARIGYSPNYLAAGWHTLYGGVDLPLVADGTWLVEVHGGALLWIAGGRPRDASFAHYDWQITATRRIGAVRLSAGWGGGGPQRDRYGGRARGHGAPTFAIATAF